jgi:tellurite resistance protein
MTEGGLTHEEVDVFARGLYHLATRDGIDEREEKLIRGFLEDAKSDLRWDDLADTTFSPLEAAQILDTTYLRRIFVKAAVALVKADGHFSDKERHALGEIADAFGIDNTEFGDLEQAAEKAALE